MNRIIHKIEQGSPEWHAFRANHFGASEASAMLGISPYKNRQALLREKATGIEPEVSPQLRGVFDRGHATEAGGREIAEGVLGEDLFPIVVSCGKLSASCDGINFDGDTAFEHKQWNAELAAAIRAGKLPEHHQPQCQQVIHVTGALRVLFMVSDGTAENCAWMYVEPDQAWIDRIVTGWAQFEEDLAGYQHVEAKPAPVVADPDALPALAVEISGRVLSSNLVVWQQAIAERIQAINTDLQTDDDFAVAERTVKFLDDGEKTLDIVKSQALAQTASIDELFRAIDTIKSEMRAKRLNLDKLVKARKETIRAEILQEGQAAYLEHIEKLNGRLGIRILPMAGKMPAFGEAMKGKKTVATLRDAVHTELANAKIVANEIAGLAQENIQSLKAEERDWTFLFPDLSAVCTKSADDFANLRMARIATHKAAEEKRLEAERERIRNEEAARLAAQPAPSATHNENAPVRIESVATPVPMPKPLEAVVDHQAEIAAFLASREWKKGEETKVRAVLIEFFKWRSGTERKAD